MIEYEEVRLANGMFRWAPVDIEKPRDLDPVEKIALGRKHDLLREKSVHQEMTCWLCTTRNATTWVFEVGFDFKGDKAEPIQHIAISSQDYEGPVPGFCPFCIAEGPAQLAEKVYFDRPEMYWGVRPTRWFVIFTDGMKQGDRIVTIDPKGELPEIVEEFIT